MEKQKYLNEIQRLLETDKEPASLEFCKEFINRLESVNHDNCPEEFLGRDSEDYWAWGQALGGLGEDDGENFVWDHDPFGDDEEIRSPEFLKQMEE